MPDPEWDGVLSAGRMGDESPLVRAFAARHPRIEPSFFANEGICFDERMDDMLLAMGVPAAGLPNMYHYHTLWHAARRAGCDVMVFADLGNQTFSNAGSWAYAEFLVRGRWVELYRLLRDREGDSRPLWRRFAAHCVLNNLPLPLMRAAQRLIHGDGPVSKGVTPVRRSFAARSGALAAAQVAAGDWDRYLPRTRREEIARSFFSGSPEADDIRQGFEQLYNIAYRVPPAYRPLVEFCWSLPTAQYVRRGESRWLAKRMAIGDLPEPQRLNRRYGQHSVDWHLRIGSKRGEWSDAMRHWQQAPEIADRLDLERMLKTLDEDWPATTTWDRATYLSVAMGVPRAVMNAKFIGLVSGRNEP